MGRGVVNETEAEPFVLPNATHGLQVMNPRGMAEALTGFLARQRAAVAAVA